MPTTRRKVIKPTYKDENQSDEEEMKDFSDSGSEAHISEESESEDDVISDVSSGTEFTKAPKLNIKKTAPKKPMPKRNKTLTVKKPKFAESLVSKIRQKADITTNFSSDDENVEGLKKFSIKDMTAADKLLPSILNLSESDSSDDESPSTLKKVVQVASNISCNDNSESETETQNEYKDIWSKHLQPDNSEEVAQKAFIELEKHNLRIEEAKASIQQYSGNNESRNSSMEVDVNDLLAQGEEAQPIPEVVKKSKKNKARNDSDSEMEDWEEVNENKAIPKQGLQLIVEFPDGSYKKSKKVDVEMMMRRKINRVKKEYQVYMHQVHVLAWLGHGLHVSRALNDRRLLAAALALVPSDRCFPGERVDINFIEQITTWYKDKLTFKQDKNEDKFKPKAPPLIEILLTQIKSKVVTTKKYLVYIFICIMRAMGLQCRVMLNFVTLPIKPPQSELCSLSTKQRDETTAKTEIKKEDIKSETKNKEKSKKNKSKPIKQLDGPLDSSTDDDEFENIMQLDGNDDTIIKTRRGKAKAKLDSDATKKEEEDVTPPKKSKVIKKSPAKEMPEKKLINSVSSKQNCKSESNEKINLNENKSSSVKASMPSPRKTRSNVNNIDKNKDKQNNIKDKQNNIKDKQNNIKDKPAPKKKSKAEPKAKIDQEKQVSETKNTHTVNPPKIVVTDTLGKDRVSKYFDKDTRAEAPKKLSLSRKRSHTAMPTETDKKTELKEKDEEKAKTRTRSVPGTSVKTSKYFNSNEKPVSPVKKSAKTRVSKQDLLEDKQRVSHRDLMAKSKPKNDVKGDLIDIIKKRVAEAKTEAKRKIVKGKAKPESSGDSDFLPEEDVPKELSDSDGDFKPSKISPNPKSMVKKKIDRRVLSPDEEKPKNKVDVWCEVFVEELEQWVAVDVVRARVHCATEIYNKATHPVCYVIGWDNSNHLKDLTRRYVPHFNTVTRKQRAAPQWLAAALRPWCGPRTARDAEEDDQLDRMQMDAPLPKSIAEYKNHPLYALQRHLLKFEALFPPDAAPLGFVRGEPVYARECVHTCQSRDKWLKEAKVVKLGEKPYKVVKARPKWDRLSNKCITDLPLEIFGPWQVADYEPPTAENGLVPRNAYGNVELFKECMLPKGTVHMKLPGLAKVAKKLNIDCANAMTGFDYNGGFSHPVYDGFVVCSEFEDILVQAWEQDQEDQERKENEKLENRVYGNWKRLIKGLLIRERLKDKYGLELASSKPEKKKPTGPKLVVKKGA